MFSYLFFLNSILFGIGLAMDAFSVSLANGLNNPNMPKSKGAGVAGTFSAFQFLMPLIGWVCVHTIANLFTSFQKFIPWIALILLCYIGGKMLIDGIKARKGLEVEKTDLTFGALMIQGIATSIDALSVGFTIADYSLLMAVIESLIIGIVTFFICVAGILIGRKFGTKLAWRASVLGGVILIGIGLEIFLSHML